MKNRVKNFNKLLNTLVNNLPFTIIPVIIYFLLLGGVLSCSSILNSSFFSTFSVVCLILIPNNFLIESLNTDKTTKKVSLFISVVLALTIGIMSNFGSEIFLSKLLHICIGYALTLFFISVYLNYKNSNNEFGNYLLKTLSSFIKITINYFALAFGVLFITLAFNYLILNDIDFLSVLSLQTIVFGCYYLPSLIYRLYKPEKEAEDFFKTLISYILIPIVAIIFIIVYLYILKLLITLNLPGNQVFELITIFFLIAMPVWTMSKHLKLNKTESKLAFYFPYLFVPLIFIQIYCLSIRVVNYGLTTARYLCISFVLLEIIYYILYFTDSKKCGQILLFMAGFAFVTYSIPYINMYDLSNQNQYNRLNKYLEIENPSDDELQALSSSYYYLYFNVEGKNYLNDININKSYIESISNTYYSGNNNYYNTDELELNFDVKDYTNARIVNGNIENNNVNILQDNQTILTFTNTESFYQYISNRENLQNYLTKNSKIEINNNNTLILTKLEFTYNDNTEEVNNFTFQGILLTK